MSNSSRAMVFTRSGKPLKMIEFPLPVLSKGEMLARIEYSTICGSDLHTFLGKRSTPSPTIFRT